MKCQKMSLFLVLLSHFIFPTKSEDKYIFTYFKWSNCIIVFTRVKPSNIPCKFQCMTKKMRRYGRQNAYITRDKKLKNISNMKIRSKIVPNDVFSLGIKLKPLNSGWFNIWNILIYTGLYVQKSSNIDIFLDIRCLFIF